MKVRTKTFTADPSSWEQALGKVAAFVEALEPGRLISVTQGAEAGVVVWYWEGLPAGARRQARRPSFLRRLVRLAALTCLLLFTAVVAPAYVHSCFAYTAVRWSAFVVDGDLAWDKDFRLTSSRGGLLIYYSRQEWTIVRPGTGRFEPPRPAAWEYASARLYSLPYPALQAPAFKLVGLEVGGRWNDMRKGSSFDVGVTEAGVVVPYLALLAPAGTMAAWWLYRLRRGLARQRQGGVPCTECGYDLRATPGRCPECGTSTSVPTTG